MSSISQGRGDSWNPGPPAPPIFAPGTQFRYWDDAMMQFGSLLTKAAGEPLDRLFKTRIADRHRNDSVAVDENDSATGRVLSWTGGIHTSSRDLARFGHLVLNRGNWNGRQLVERLVDRPGDSGAGSRRRSRMTTCRDRAGRGFTATTGG